MCSGSLFDRAKNGLNLHNSWLKNLNSDFASTSSNEYFAATLLELGLTRLYASSELNDAEICFQDIIGIVQNVLKGEDDDHLVASALHGLGCCLYKKGYIEEAREQFIKSLQMKRRLKGKKTSDFDIALTLYRLGQTYALSGSCYIASGFYRECCSLKREVSLGRFDFDEESKSLYKLAFQGLHEADLHCAETLLRDSISPRRECCDASSCNANFGIGLQYLADAYFENGRLEDAQRTFREALNLYGQVPFTYLYQAVSLKNLHDYADFSASVQVDPNAVVSDFYNTYRKLYPSGFTHLGIARILLEHSTSAYKRNSFIVAEKLMESLKMQRDVYEKSEAQESVSVTLFIFGNLLMKIKEFD